MEQKHFDALCGLDCSTCPAYIATINNDESLRIRIAKEWTERYRREGRSRPAVKPEDINCKGCLSGGPLYLYCGQCKIRKCGLKKKITSCSNCPDYICADLAELRKHFIKSS